MLVHLNLHELCDGVALESAAEFALDRERGDAKVGEGVGVVSHRR